jgi:hypothetical protein
MLGGTRQCLLDVPRCRRRPLMEHRPSPLRVGPHGRGNGVLKAGGVVHPWGHSAARRCGLSIAVLGARSISWRWIGTRFEACRSSTVLAVWLGGVAGGRASQWMLVLLGRASSFCSWFLCGCDCCRHQRSDCGGFRSASVVSWWQESSVAVLSMYPLRCASGRGQVVLCVGQSRVCLVHWCRSLV